ncbi:bacillithiol system redox-active protein YtxJ [Haoranjiania flava]|uniref:Bacillithiol system redox-active protein YtxJ n=1 Tax=Haoranjiania flava TaxID=1856322 RepID=A0AAE3LR25_9BACT|nr:bacillithiol system redox-active protein YtxJ [Haoranjiania flava]MCU7695040.1 bacillithiol system redox-active protein YtxJ [Haoranjiania flava]
MNWHKLENTEQIKDIINHSFDKPQVIFKHSTSCGISSVALNRFEKSTDVPEADFHFLDLRKYREVSNAVTSTFHVMHESPQVLVIRDGQCIYHESHYSIDMFEVSRALS